jgi:hypothetical protein
MLRSLLPHPAVPRAQALGAGGLAAGVILATWPAWAELSVRMPEIDFHSLSFEQKGLIPLGRKGAVLAGEQNYTGAVAYGVLPFWALEVEGGLISGDGQRLSWEGTSLENTFALAGEGEFPVSLAIFAEYFHSHSRGEPDSVTFGPVIQKELRNVLGIDSVHTLNLFLEHEVGSGANPAVGFEYAWQSVLSLSPYASPAIELYGLIPDLAHSGHFRQQEYLAGPVVVGDVKLPTGQVHYETGYLFGLTPASSRGAVVWRVEYAISF